jgi:Repeat of unknown function (DUF346)
MSHFRESKLRQCSFASAITMCFAWLLLLGPVSGASAYEEHQFCWGSNLQPGEWCGSGNWYIHAAYANGVSAPICLIGPEGVGGDCTAQANEGIYIGASAPYGYYGKAQIYNPSFSTKVYGVFWTGEPAPAPPPPPQATWHSGDNLGGNILDAPDISSSKSGRLDVFARGNNNYLHTNWFPGTTWQGWSSLGGPTLESGPGAVSWSSSRTDVVGRAANGNLLHWWYDGSWHSENLGGNIVGDPDISSFASGRLDVFARGTDNTLLHKYFANNTWSGWESLGGSLVSGPGAVSWGNNRIDVVGRASDNSVTHWWWEWGLGWHSGDNLGGVIVGDPDISSWGSGRLDVFARGANDYLHHKWYQGSWSNWENLGGPLLSSGPGAVSWSSNRVDVVGRATDGSVTHWWYGS